METNNVIKCAAADAEDCLIAEGRGEQHRCGKACAYAGVKSSPSPGPWTFEDSAHIYDADAVPVAVMLPDSGYPKLNANAALIAAAPDLLEASERAYAVLGDVRNQWFGRHSDAGQALLIALREAISKATGREPQDVQDDYCNRAIAKATA